MLLPTPLTTTHETFETLHETDDGSLVAARDAQGADVLLFVPRCAEIGSRERERLEFLRGPGVPVPRPATGDGGEAIVLEGAAGARPLLAAGPLPDGVWRPAVVRLLSALSHVHGRGFVHGRISRGHILADPAGEFWIHGWAGARPAVGRGPFQTGMDDVGADVRDLGVAFVRHFADAAADDEPLDESSTQRAVARVAVFDRELSRVLRRLVAADPREGYENATEVLTDLGERDESLHDPYADLEFVGRRRLVRTILAHSERAGTRGAWLGSFEIIGAPGSGKSRVLAEVARAARARGHVVMHAHGGAPDQPWGAVGNFARQMLARLPADHPLRARRGVSILVGECPSPTGRETDVEYGDGASAALADLVTDAFRGVKGLLLLDDEDALSSHARQVWRGLGKHVATASGSSQAASVLLVTTSARPSEDELGVPRERVTLDDLALRHVARMLAGILTERGKSAILAAEIHAVAGGRPGDVVEHLRDLVDRRSLVPVGRRFHVDDPVPAARAGVGVDRFRRALETAGRDGATLAAVIAVAGRLRFAREVISEIADLAGHRLHAAADAALRAGLLARDGASWRVRTQSLRERLEGALADDRRRSLHREVLARLLDADTPDWPAIAHHGRAASDPRAAEWTRTALAVLRAAGRYDEAATHFDDARALLDPSDLDVALRLVQIDTLLNAGRLGDATRVADEVSRDPVATPRQRGEAVLALARLHRFDQAWSRVLAIELPLDCGDPVVLAKIRLLRATSHVFRGHPDLASREARLALAEVGDDPAARKIVEIEALEYEHDAALLLHRDPPRGHGRILAHIRHRRSAGHHLDVALDLVRIANIARLSENPALADQCLRRAHSVCTSQASSNALALSWIHFGRSLVADDLSNPRRRTASAEAAALYAARTGASVFAFNKRIQLAKAQALHSTVPPSTVQFIRILAQSIADVAPDSLALIAGDLQCLFMFLGSHSACSRLAALATEMHIPQIPARAVAAWGYVSDRLIDAPLSPAQELSLTLPNGPEQVASDSTYELLSYRWRPCATDADRARTAANVSFMASCIRRGIRRASQWPATWTDNYILRLYDSLDPRCPAAADILFAMMLEPWESLSPDLWIELKRRAQRVTHPLPLGTEWRRALAFARVHWFESRFLTATRLARESERQLCHLADLNDPPQASLLRQHGLALISRLAISIPRASTAHPNRRNTAPRGPILDPICDAWREPLHLATNSPRLTAVSRYLRELQLFSARVCDSTGLRIVRLQCTPTAPLVSHHDLACVALTPHGGIAWLPEALSTLHAHTQAGGRVLLLTSYSVSELRGLGSAVRALLEMVEGPIVEPPALCANPTRRAALFTTALHSVDARNWTVTNDCIRELVAHSWPGGFAEMEGVARALACWPSSEVTIDSLNLTGWAARASGDSEFGSADSLEALSRALTATPWAGSRDLSSALSMPTRSVVRLLSRLVSVGRLQRRGRGRATTYALPHAP